MFALLLPPILPPFFKLIIPPGLSYCAVCLAISSPITGSGGATGVVYYASEMSSFCLSPEVFTSFHHYCSLQILSPCLLMKDDVSVLRHLSLTIITITKCINLYIYIYCFPRLWINVDL